MDPYCIYVFDSSTANEAALAVKEGQFQSIIQYHSNKHQAQLPPQHQQQQPYDPNLSPQKMKERESKLNRLGQLAQLTTQPPITTQHHLQQQQQPAPMAQQQQPLPPQPQQHLDPLSSMAAMSECPIMDSFGHTIHHRPSS